jgi:hypothetical protein
MWAKYGYIIGWTVALLPMVAWYVIRLRRGKRLDLGGPSIGEIRSREGDGVAQLVGFIDDCNDASENAALEQLLERKAREDFAFEKSSLELALSNGYDPELDELVAKGRTAEAYAEARDRAEAAHMANNQTAERTYRTYVEQLGGLPVHQVEL